MEMLQNLNQRVVLVNVMHDSICSWEVTEVKRIKNFLFKQQKKPCSVKW